MARLTLQNLSKSFPHPGGESVAAVQDVTLKVDEGTFFVVLGPSGSGKSTLLRLIAGLESPDNGTVAIDGMVVNKVPPHVRDVAMVFQNYALYPHLNVRENLALGLKARQLARSEIDRRINETSHRLGLTDTLDRLPGRLSGGERQRVAIGRALVRAPRILLLDEPLSNIDPALRERTRLELLRLQYETGTTVVMVTHDQNDALGLAMHAAILAKGAIQQAGTPLELYRDPSNLFVAGFMGSPPMNRVRGRLEGSGAQCCFVPDSIAPGTGDSFRLPLGELLQPPLESPSGQAVVLGIRAEHVTPDHPGSPLHAQIERVEPTGPSTLLHMRAAGQELIVRADNAGSFTPGAILSLSVDLAHACLFDAVKGRRIDRGRR